MITNGIVLNTRETRRELVVEREEPFQTLTDAVRRYLDSGAGRGAFIHGPTGAGKTMLAEQLAEQLERERMAMASAYVNVWEHTSTTEVLATALGAVGRPISLDQRGTPRAELRRWLREAHADPLLLVLDEVHQVDEPDLVGKFLRTDDVFLVLICNDRMDLTRRLDRTSRVRGLSDVHLPAYSTATLERILLRRAKYGLEDGADVDAFVGAVAGRAGGDARVAITALSEAAGRAGREGRLSIPADWTEWALLEAEDAVRQRPLSYLTETQRAIYEVLVDAGEWLAMGELDAGLGERGVDVSRQTIRRHLGSLEHYNLAESAGKTKGRRYRGVTG